MGLKETLDLIMQYPRIKSIAFETRNTQNGPMQDVVSVELYPDQPQVQTHPMPLASDIPPDDVMLFAATEDIDELMKQRKSE